MKKNKRTLPSKVSAVTTTFSTPSREIYPNKVMILTFVIMVLIVCIIRMKYLNLPLSRDEGSYAYLGWQALQGYKPYQDFYEMKPPLLFYSYAVLINFFGLSVPGLHLGFMFINIFNAILICIIGHKIQNWNFGISAAICFLFFSLNPYMYGIQAVAEHFVVMYFCLAIIFLLHFYEKRKNWQLVLCGIFISVAILTKQTAVFLSLFIAISLAIFLIKCRDLQKRKKLIYFLIWISGYIIPMILTLVVFLRLNAFDDFIFWVFDFPAKYASTVTWRTGLKVLTFFVKGIISYDLMLWLLAALGLMASAFVTFRNLDRYQMLILLACSAFAIVPGKRFYGQYWILLLPVLSLYAALFFACVLERTIKKKYVNRVWASCLAVIVIIQCVVNSSYYFSPDFARILYKVHPGNNYYDLWQIASFLSEHVEPDDVISVMGSEPQIYVYLKKQSPTKHIYPSLIKDNLVLQKEALAEIKRANPEWIILSLHPFSWALEDDSQRFLYEGGYRYAVENYRTFAYMKLNKKLPSSLITGSEAGSFRPTSDPCIIVYHRL